MATTCALSATSQVKPMTVWPAERSPSAAVLSFSSSRSASTTAAPASAKALVVARPIPASAGERASVDGRYCPRRLAIRQEHRAGGATSQEPRKEQRRPGLREHPLDRPALAADTSALVGQIEVL